MTRAPLLMVTEQWSCPNCDVTDTTRGLPAQSARFHTCAGLHGLNAPLIRAGVRCKVEAEERQEYLGSELQARGDDGRQYMAVRTTTDDHDDLLVFAGLARAEMRHLMSEQAPDPDVIRGIERVTGEVYDPETGQWRQPPAVIAQAGLASAAAVSGPDENED